MILKTEKFETQYFNKLIPSYLSIRFLNYFFKSGTLNPKQKSIYFFLK